MFFSEPLRRPLSSYWERAFSSWETVFFEQFGAFISELLGRLFGTVVNVIFRAIVTPFRSCSGRLFGAAETNLFGLFGTEELRHCIMKATPYRSQHQAGQSPEYIEALMDSL